LTLLVAIAINNVKVRFSRGREGGVMRVSKEKAAENRERIVTEAARLFREHGLSGVGVNALTDAAGLTHGSLYSQFGSKERLAAEALSHAASTSSARMSDAGTLDDYIARYLSADHRQRRGDGCVMAALVGEIPRHGATIRRNFTDAVRGVMKRIASLMPSRRKSEDEALAIVTTMVGALSLARAVDDPELSDRILAAARTRLMLRQPNAASSLIPERHGEHDT
jgi:TetR/AcrR family transcriptional regulator, transcriptional repressor for nem operon